MNTKEYLEYVVKEIHTVIVATVDDDGLPVTSAIDMMDADENITDYTFFAAVQKNLFFICRICPFLSPCKPNVLIIRAR